VRANSAKSVAAGTQKRGKHRLDAAARRQISVPDNTGGDLGLAAVSAGAYRRHPVHEFGFADRAHLDRTRVPVHRVRLRDTTPIASVIGTPLVMMVNPSFPAKTVPAFLAHAKANPDKINMASSGSGSAPHVAGELFKIDPR
jgi:tripartite-type tricarboxylate transporter receptor subunit TctC